MATPLDVGLLQNFQIIFPFLFVFTLTYAILSTAEVFKNKSVQLFVAFLLAIMTLFSSIAVKTINLMAPWFVLLFIFGLFIIIAYQVFGVKQERITEVITGKTHGSTFFYWVLALVLIIGISSLLTVLGEENALPVVGNATTIADSAGEGTFGFWDTIRHPKVLGLAVILLISYFAVRFLSENLGER